MVGARGRGSAHFQEMEPQEISEDRAAQHQEKKRAKKLSIGRDLMNVGEGSRNRQQRDACRKILDAIAEPEAALWREQLEQQRPGDDGGKRRQREKDAMQTVRSDRYAVPDYQDDANDP